MQAFQNAAAAFCIACICAEVTALLTGTGWAGRCIKAVARAIYSSSPFPAGTGCEAGTEKRHGGGAVLCPYPECRNIDPAESAGAAGKLPADRVYAALWGTDRTGHHADAGGADRTGWICRFYHPIRMYRRRKAAGRRISAGSTRHGIGTGDAGGSRMKETEGFSIRLFAEKCKGKQGRARLAAAVGLLAMLLILLSELFPAAFCGRQHPESQKRTKQHRISGTIGGAAGTADLSYERCGQDHCDGHTGNRGGSDLCIGHAVRRLAVAADACLAGGWFCPD